MLLSKVLGTIGRFCISLGVLTLLFVAYQLWGTGVLTAQAQGELENDFESLLVEVTELEAELDSEPAPPVLEEPDDASDDTSTAEAKAALAAEAELLAQAQAEADAVERERLSNVIWQPNGRPVAKLSIPDIDLQWTVVEGVGTDELRDGPGHYGGTPMPGMPGNAGIAGHRTTWGAPFNRIDELDPGDIITIRTVQGVFEYRVIEQDSGKGHFIVTPDRVDVLDQDFTDHPNRLTLTACHPKFSARQRIIVVAELVGEPADFIPPPGALGLGEGPTLASEDFGSENAVEPPAEAQEDLPGDPDLIVAEPANTDDEPATDDSPDEADSGDITATAGGGDDDDNLPDSLSLQSYATDDFGQGLNGDRSAILPAVMWGLAAAAIAAAAGFIARRWKKLPTYAMSMAPFALVLFMCFVHIDQALPSY